MTLLKITIFPIEFYRLEQYIIVGLCVVFPFGEDARIGKNSVQTMKFVLKQYDTALLSFDLRSEGLDGFVCTRHTGRKGVSALWTPPTKEDDICNLNAYAKTRTPYFGSSFRELAAVFMNDRQRKLRRKLIDFRFTRDRNYNLPAKRLKALEAFLQRRIRKLSAFEK